MVTDAPNIFAPTLADARARTPFVQGLGTPRGLSFKAAPVYKPFGPPKIEPDVVEDWWKRHLAEQRIPPKPQLPGTDVPTGAARKALVPTGLPAAEFAGSPVAATKWWEELLAKFRGVTTPQGDRLPTPMYRPTGSEALGTGPSMFAGDTKAIGPAIAIPEAIVPEAIVPEAIAKAAAAPKGLKRHPKGPSKKKTSKLKKLKKGGALLALGAAAGLVGHQVGAHDPDAPTGVADAYDPYGNPLR